MALEARAIKRHIQGSPRKMRLVADLIRGKSVDEAISILHFSPKHASRVCEQTLRSAGCLVTRLSGDGYVLATALESLFAKG